MPSVVHIMFSSWNWKYLSLTDSVSKLEGYIADRTVVNIFHSSLLYKATDILRCHQLISTGITFRRLWTNRKTESRNNEISLDLPSASYGNAIWRDCLQTKEYTHNPGALPELGYVMDTVGLALSGKPVRVHFHSLSRWRRVWVNLFISA